MRSYFSWTAVHNAFRIAENLQRAGTWRFCFPEVKTNCSIINGNFSDNLELNTKPRGLNSVELATRQSRRKIGEYSSSCVDKTGSFALINYELKIILLLKFIVNNMFFLLPIVD